MSISEETNVEKYKVLIIEDSETAKKQLAKVIKKEGFQVFTAENGKIGLEIFKLENPEIVITDLKMPDVDGMEVIHTVHRLSPVVQTILITAYGETETVISALREGVLDYIKKPIDLDQLSLALGRAREKINQSKQSIPFPTLLLAEDEAATRERLSRILVKEGWEVFQAGNGVEALEIFKEQKIDVVLLDIKMPQMDGLETLHEMRGITDDFEAIIITGYGDEKSAIQAMRDGAINFIKKPIDLDQMIFAVQRAMEKLSSDRALRFRTRELELSREIIARITEDRKIIIDLRGFPQGINVEFAKQLLDTITLALVVINNKMEIVYQNSQLRNAVNDTVQTVDEKFMKQLEKVGISGLELDTLKTETQTLFDSSEETIRTIKVGKYASLALLSMRILTEKMTEDVILIAIRGERK